MTCSVDCQGVEYTIYCPTVYKLYTVKRHWKDGRSVRRSMIRQRTVWHRMTTTRQFASGCLGLPRLSILPRDPYLPKCPMLTEPNPPAPFIQSCSALHTKLAGAQGERELARASQLTLCTPHIPTCYLACQMTPSTMCSG